MTDKLARPLAERVAGLSAPNEPGEGPAAPQSLLNGAIAALDEGKTKYTDRPGIIGLRQWVSDEINRRYPGIELTPDQVTITCGVEEARFVTVTYLTYGGNPDFSIPFTEVNNEKAIYLSNTDAWSQPSNNQHIIWDSRGWPDEHPAQRFDAMSRTITIGEFPDTGAGWRVGWMAGHGDHAKIRAYKQSMTICTPSASQWAILAMLEAQS
jgi:aspartate/methionine/tyrosine aminotransferase